MRHGKSAATDKKLKRKDEKTDRGKGMEWNDGVEGEWEGTGKHGMRMGTVSKTKIGKARGD